MKVKTLPSYVYDVVLQCRNCDLVARYGDGGDPAHPEKSQQDVAEATLDARRHAAFGHEVEVIVGKVYVYAPVLRVVA